MTRDVICNRCGCIIGKEETVRATNPKKGKKLCDNCKEKSVIKNKERLTKQNKSKNYREQVSARMKSKNPMYKEETRTKMGRTLHSRYVSGELVSVLSDPVLGPEIRKSGKITDAGRKRLSQRMKKDNPMCDTQIRKKVSETLSHNIASGITSYKRGPDHHLWKGNRKLNDLCRQLLYPVWTKEILKRDGYTCRKCGVSRCKLHAHHIKPLHKIIDDAMLENNIVSSSQLNERERYNLAEKVVAKHSLNDGITVCRKCHSLIDDHYRELSNENS